MSFEPYVDDPAEPPPARRLAGARTSIAVAAVGLLLAALWLLTGGPSSDEDPSLQQPRAEQR